MASPATLSAMLECVGTSARGGTPSYREICCSIIHVIIHKHNNFITTIVVLTRIEQHNRHDSHPHVYLDWVWQREALFRERCQAHFDADTA